MNKNLSNTRAREIQYSSSASQKLLASLHGSIVAQPTARDRGVHAGTAHLNGIGASNGKLVLEFICSKIHLPLDRYHEHRGHRTTGTAATLLCCHAG